MRILLQHTATHLYFQSPDSWTNDPACAFDFRFLERALGFVRSWDLQEVELAFAFDDSQHVTAMPLAQAALRYTVA